MKKTRNSSFPETPYMRGVVPVMFWVVGCTLIHPCLLPPIRWSLLLRWMLNWWVDPLWHCPLSLGVWGRAVRTLLSSARTGTTSTAATNAWWSTAGERSRSWRVSCASCWETRQPRVRSQDCLSWSSYSKEALCSSIENSLPGMSHGLIHVAVPKRLVRDR